MRLPPAGPTRSGAGFTSTWRCGAACCRHFSGPDLLCVGVTVGLGASPLLTKLGWCVLPWSQIPFVASLIAVPLTGYEERVGEGWIMPSLMHPYEGPRLTYAPDSYHPWTRFYHFWVAREDLARQLDEDVCAAAGGDLRRWRDAVVMTNQVAPVPFWRLSFYEE